MRGLLAPELVVHTAWIQWESARVFEEKVKEFRKNKWKNGAETSQSSHNESTEIVHTESNVTSDELHDDYPRSLPKDDAVTSGGSDEVTMTHGFYAGMV